MVSFIRILPESVTAVWSWIAGAGGSELLLQAISPRQNIKQAVLNILLKGINYSNYSAIPLKKLCFLN
jgi:hypothetical protein